MKTPFLSNIVKSKYKKYVDETGLKIKTGEAVPVPPATQSSDTTLPEVAPEIKEEAFNELFEDVEGPVEGEKVENADSLPLSPDEQAELQNELGDFDKELENALESPVDEHVTPVNEITATPVIVKSPEAAPLPAVLDPATLAPASTEVKAVEIKVADKPTEVTEVTKNVEAISIPTTLEPMQAKPVDTKFLAIPELVNLIEDKNERKEFNPAIISLEARLKKQKGGMTASDLEVYLAVSRRAHVLDPQKWENTASWLRELARLRKKKSNKIKDADPLTESALFAEMNDRIKADCKL
jgi:hypothetical protein